MMKVKTNIKKAILNVEKQISGLAQFEAGGIYSGPMSGEGYTGGYRDALQDVLLVLNGVQPRRRDYWDDWIDELTDIADN